MNENNCEKQGCKMLTPADALPSLFGVPWTTWLNFLLQWFFIRITAIVSKEGKVSRYAVIKWVVPLTGFFGKYRWIGKERKVTLPKQMTKKYTKEEVLSAMKEKNFLKQFEGCYQESIEYGLKMWNGKLRKESLNELCLAFSSKVVGVDMAPQNTMCLTTDINLPAYVIVGLPDPLGMAIITTARQAMAKLSGFGTSDFARFVDCAKLQFYEPNPDSKMAVRVKIEFHVWYATTSDGFEPVQHN